MKRNNDADMGSLELLLDTMCNTFGCLIFISILLCILTQQIGHSIVDEMDPTKIVQDLRAATVLVKELEGEIRDLEQQLTLFATAPLEIPPEADLTKAYEQAKKDHDEAASEKEEAEDQTKTSERELAKAQAIHEELARELERLKEEETKADQITVGIEAERPVGNLSGIMHLAFHRGKLYAITKLPGNAGLDMSQVSAREVSGPQGQAVQVTLKPNAGTPVPLQGELPQAVKRLLGETPRDAFIMFHVDPQSFEHFTRVRDALLEVNNHPPYNWMPVNTAEPIMFSVGESVIAGPGRG